MQKIKEDFIQSGGKFEKYKLESSELFSITGTKSLDEGYLTFVNNGINFVGRVYDNNGIKGKILLQNFKPNEKNTITATVIGNYKYVKFQKEPYYCSQNINKLTPHFKINEKISKYLITHIQKYVSQFDGQQDGYKLDAIQNHKVILPSRNNIIDFKYMEDYIREFEKESISKLENYLDISGLKNYTLTDTEKKFINYSPSNNILTLLSNKLHTTTWKEYKMDNIFEKIATKKLPYKAKKLPNKATGKYILPCLTSSFMNQGLNYYAPTDNATILKNVISIPSNSDVYRAYFQSNDFTVLSDAYAICWKDKNKTVTENEYLFMTQCINKITDLPIYSYKNKLGGWNKVKEKSIVLPEKDGKIDFDFMDKFILILKKLIIKNVVEYTNKKLIT